MSDPSTSLPKPASPAPSRAPAPGALGGGARKPGMGLLAGKPTGSTPIPPSMQAKMAAIANRAQPPPGPPGVGGGPGSPMAMAGRGPGGLAARRTRPGPQLHLSAIDGAIPASAGPAGGGLGAGRPNFDQPRRPNVAETPFAALSNIV
jgi:mitogen-activated protein kinase kinase